MWSVGEERNCNLYDIYSSVTRLDFKYHVEYKRFDYYYQSNKYAMMLCFYQTAKFAYGSIFFLKTYRN